MRYKGAVHAPSLKSPYSRRPTREIKTSGLCIIEWNPCSLSWKHILQSTRAYIIKLELIKINLFPDNATSLRAGAKNGNAVAVPACFLIDPRY